MKWLLMVTCVLTLSTVGWQTYQLRFQDKELKAGQALIIDVQHKVIVRMQEKLDDAGVLMQNAADVITAQDELIQKLTNANNRLLL